MSTRPDVVGPVRDPVYVDLRSERDWRITSFIAVVVIPLVVLWALLLFQAASPSLAARIAMGVTFTLIYGGWWWARVYGGPSA